MTAEAVAPVRHLTAQGVLDMHADLQRMLTRPDTEFGDYLVHEAKRIEREGIELAVPQWAYAQLHPARNGDVQPWLDSLGTDLFGATTYQVTAEMVKLAKALEPSTPNLEELIDDDLPSPWGFLWLDEPIERHVVNDDGPPEAMHAVSWARVPAIDVADGGGVCDFCNRQVRPEVMFGCASFTMRTVRGGEDGKTGISYSPDAPGSYPAWVEHAPLLGETRYDGGWAACEGCAPLVRKRAWAALEQQNAIPDGLSMYPMFEYFATGQESPEPRPRPPVPAVRLRGWEYRGRPYPHPGLRFLGQCLVPLAGGHRSVMPQHRLIHLLWILMGAEVTTVETVLPQRHGRKRAANLRYQEVRVVQLRRARHREDDGAPRPVDWSCTWLVRGHWRKAPHGGTFADGRDRTWIAPYVKGPDGAPLRASDIVYRLSR